MFEAMGDTPLWLICMALATSLMVWQGYRLESKKEREESERAGNERNFGGLY